jgi:hypothetical protein
VSPGAQRVSARSRGSAAAFPGPLESENFRRRGLPATARSRPSSTTNGCWFVIRRFRYERLRDSRPLLARIGTINTRFRSTYRRPVRSGSSYRAAPSGPGTSDQPSACTRSGTGLADRRASECSQERDPHLVGREIRLHVGRKLPQPVRVAVPQRGLRLHRVAAAVIVALLRRRRLAHPGACHGAREGQAVQSQAGSHQKVSKGQFA